MAQGKKIAPAFTSLEDAFLNGSERDLVVALIVKLTHTIDGCDSARDLRPLMNGTFEALDRLHAIDAATNGGGKDETPLAVILGKAS